MKSVLFSKKPAPDPELLALQADLRDVKSELAQAHQRFNQVVDPELVESWIFQINALNARYNYIIRSIKARSPESMAAFGKDSAVKSPTHEISGPPSKSNAAGYDVCENEEDALWT